MVQVVADPVVTLFRQVLQGLLGCLGLASWIGEEVRNVTPGKPTWESQQEASGQGGRQTEGGRKKKDGCSG